MRLNIGLKPAFAAAALAGIALLGACSNSKVKASGGQPITDAPGVGVSRVARKPIERQLTVSSELVPFQEIDIYAKESGYIKELPVDYGSRLKKGDLVAVLDIPELQIQLTQDAAAITNQEDVVKQTQHQVDRVNAMVKDYELQYKRLKSVSDSRPGLVAQQEVDDKETQYASAQAQLEAARSTNQSAQSELAQAQAKLERDRALFDYSRIVAPFPGVVTQRYANYGTLVQAGTSSSTNVLPIVKLSEDDVFRLVIPVPEGYVKYIHVGDPVEVHVSSLDRNFPGKVARFSFDVMQDTRTMHTEVDVPNPGHLLMPGMYADAKVTLQKINDALAVPLQAINHESARDTVFVVNSDNKIEVRPVQLGLQGASWSQVTSGVKEGEMVVVSDRASLKSGMAVQPHEVEMTEYQAQSQ